MLATSLDPLYFALGCFGVTGILVVASVATGWVAVRGRGMTRAVVIAVAVVVCIAIPLFLNALKGGR